MTDGTQRPISGARLADYCSLCGGGYHPNLEIDIGDEPTVRDGDKVFGWGHVQCQRDHDREFLQAAREGQLRPVDTKTEDENHV